MLVFPVAHSHIDSAHLFLMMRVEMFVPFALFEHYHEEHPFAFNQFDYEKVIASGE